MAHSQTNFEVTIEKLIYGGEGLARLDGQVVLVPFVLPGESAAVEAVVRKPGLVRAKLVELRVASAERVVPACPYFGRCGGCHYQHASYETQLALKRDILAETLRRVGKIESPEEIRVIAAEPWNYRNRAQFHMGGVELGYLEAHSHRLCPIEQCPVSSPRINLENAKDSPRRQTKRSQSPDGSPRRNEPNGCLGNLSATASPEVGEGRDTKRTQW